MAENTKLRRQRRSSYRVGALQFNRRNRRRSGHHRSQDVFRMLPPSAKSRSIRTMNLQRAPVGGGGVRELSRAPTFYHVLRFFFKPVVQRTDRVDGYASGGGAQPYMQRFQGALLGAP